MRSKTIVKMALVSALFLGLAGPSLSDAAPIDINIYGASAQFDFWKNLGGSFLTTPTPDGAGCSVGSKTTASNGSAQYAVSATDCLGVSGQVITIRVASKASYDGIFAVSGTTGSGADNTCGNAPDQLYQRNMITSTSDTALTCQPVYVGASDVAGEAFTQQSHGALKGPLGGASTDRVFNGISTTGLHNHNPIIVPFGFFVNKAVTMKTCDSGTKQGEQCASNADCAGSTCASAGPAVLNDISRMMAVMIFSGSVKNWTDFGKGFPASMPIVACLRHAGSGTQATLDQGVMSHNAWGKNTNNQEFYGDPSFPIQFFNDGTGDMQNCINGAYGLCDDGATYCGSNGDCTRLGGGSTCTTVASSLWGAVGFMDADKDNAGGGFANIKGPLYYNGFKPYRWNIRNGLYDNFWTKQNMYTKDSQLNANQQTVAERMATFASKAANLNATDLGSQARADCWASGEEMGYGKAHDKDYPSRITPANSTLTP